MTLEAKRYATTVRNRAKDAMELHPWQTVVMSSGGPETAREMVPVSHPMPGEIAAGEVVALPAEWWDEPFDATRHAIHAPGRHLKPRHSRRGVVNLPQPDSDDGA